MAGEFSEAGIVNPTVRVDDTDLIVSWSVDPATVEAGSDYFQVYVNKRLVWSGPERVAVLPGLNVAGQAALFHVGTVAEGNRLVSYASTLDSMPGSGNRALLTWYGGGWETGVTQYLIFGSRLPDGAIDLVNPLSTIRSEGPAGFGRGPFGLAPFGHGARRYRWTSGPLASGRWLFAVMPATASGIRAADYITVQVDIVVPPSGPKAVNGKKVWISNFDQTTGIYTVKWKY
jgi:hypothetical protein